MANQAAQRRVELRVERARKNLSQQSVADAIGVERRVIVRAEAGDGISLEYALKLAAFYDRPAEELFADLLGNAA